MVIFFLHSLERQLIYSKVRRRCMVFPMKPLFCGCWLYVWLIVLWSWAIVQLVRGYVFNCFNVLQTEHKLKSMWYILKFCKSQCPYSYAMVWEIFTLMNNVIIYQLCTMQKNDDNINQDRIYVSRRRKTSDIWMLAHCFEPNPKIYVAVTSNIHHKYTQV